MEEGWRKGGGKVEEEWKKCREWAEATVKGGGKVQEGWRKGESQDGAQGGGQASMGDKNSFRGDFRAVI